MTEINEVELASVRLALAAAVAEKGEDYVYEKPQVLRYDDVTDEWYKDEADGCLYLAPVFDADDKVTDYVPSCIWGHALLTLGMDAEVLLEHNEEFGIGAPDMPRPWTDKLITEAARDAQFAQDSGRPWGEAVKAFERTIKETGHVL